MIQSLRIHNNSFGSFAAVIAGYIQLNEFHQKYNEKFELRHEETTKELNFGEIA